MTTQTTQTANCLFCYELCPVRNETLRYSGCDCTLPYHTPCINQWFAKQGYQCPLCRKAVQILKEEEDESYKNTCAMYMMLTIVVNFVLSCVF